MLTAETRNGGGGGSSSGARWSGVVSPPFLSFSSTAQPFFFSNQVGGMRGWRGWWSPNPAAKNPTVLSHLLLGFSTLGDGMVIRRGNLLFLPDFFFLDFFLLRFFSSTHCSILDEITHFVKKKTLSKHPIYIEIRCTFVTVDISSDGCGKGTNTWLTSPAENPDGARGAVPRGPMGGLESALQSVYKIAFKMCRSLDGLFLNYFGPKNYS